MKNERRWRNYKPREGSTRSYTTSDDLTPRWPGGWRASRSFRSGNGDFGRRGRSDELRSEWLVPFHEAFTAVWEAGRLTGVAQERARELRRKIEDGEADPLDVGATHAAADQMESAGESMQTMLMAWMAEHLD